MIYTTNEVSSLKTKKVFSLSEQVLLLQALIASSGFGPVIILGLICPARASPTGKTSTLKSKHTHIHCVNKTLYTLCATLVLWY